MKIAVTNFGEFLRVKVEGSLQPEGVPAFFNQLAQHFAAVLPPAPPSELEHVEFPELEPDELERRGASVVRVASVTAQEVANPNPPLIPVPLAPKSSEQND